MRSLLSRWFKVYQEEIAVFLWSSSLLFLIRTSGILFNNFTETAFLKRFGVQYLPFVTAVNSVSAFFVMGLLTGFMIKLPASRLLQYMLLFCGTSVAGLRLLIPLDISFLYPLLYVLKTQYEALLGLLFWNLANDLFNARQSKRIFPLITAGGIVGGIIGSFGTPYMAKALSFNNLMLAYGCTTFGGAAVAKMVGNRYPQQVITGKKPKEGKSSALILDELKGAFSLVKESTLAKILILLTFLPNVVIPIINYQFNFAVDQTFTSEGGMIKFFGYFRGVQNVIALVISLFVGRLYGRFGVPVALLFHPLNYLLALFALLVRFDILSAMYMRLSTGVLRTTINAPANALLFGLFPAAHRVIMRSFLRGTVVRVGVLLGSGLVLASQPLMHPRYLSLIASVFVLLWIGSTLYLKKSYSKILLDLISSDAVDLKSLEEEDAAHIFKGGTLQSQLLVAFRSARGRDTFWYAKLLKSLGTEELDAKILEKIKEEKDDATKIALLEFLSSEAGENALRLFMALADPKKPDLMAAFARTARRVYPQMPHDLQEQIFEHAQNPEVKAYMLIGLYREEPSKYEGTIATWLNSDKLPERRAGALVAGESENPAYVGKLKEMLQREEDPSILVLLLRGLDRLGTQDLNGLVLPFLSNSSELICMTALGIFAITDDATARKVLRLMGHPSDRVRHLAMEKLRDSEYQNHQLLVESLLIPNRRIHEGVFQLAEFLDLKDTEVFQFCRSQLDSAYLNLSDAEALHALSQNRERDLLMTHLNQKKGLHVENVLRALAAHDQSGRMRIVWRGLSSSDPRKKADSLEALENLTDRSMSRMIVPLLENAHPSECLALGRKYFNLPQFHSDGHQLLNSLLSRDDRVTVLLTLYLILQQGPGGISPEVVKRLLDDQNLEIREMTKQAFIPRDAEWREARSPEGTTTSIPEKVFGLQGIDLFGGLWVSELAAIASAVEDVIYPPGTTVVEPGDPGDKMYLIVSGEVSVLESGNGETNRPKELGRLGAGQSFGQMALFEEIPQSLFARTTQESQLFSLRRETFRDLILQYPDIALRICKELSARLRTLQALLGKKASASS